MKLQRDLDAARKAYLQGDFQMARKAHNVNTETATLTDGKVVHGEQHTEGGDWIKSAVFGGTDGMVTVYCVVVGAAGANLSPHVVLAMTIATLFSDAITMAFGDFLGTKSQIQFEKKEREREKWQIENNPEDEQKEMEEIYIKKGMSQADAKEMANILERNQQTWLDIMMAEELGLIPSNESPVKNGLITFASFCLFGFVPVIPFVVGDLAQTNEYLFQVSTALTLFFFAVLGFIQSFFVHIPWWKGSLEALLVGGVSAAIAYFVGMAFQPLTGNVAAH